MSNCFHLDVLASTSAEIFDWARQNRLVNSTISRLPGSVEIFNLFDTKCRSIFAEQPETQGPFTQTSLAASLVTGFTALSTISDSLPPHLQYQYSLSSPVYYSWEQAPPFADTTNLISSSSKPSDSVESIEFNEFSTWQNPFLFLKFLNIEYVLCWCQLMHHAIFIIEYVVVISASCAMLLRIAFI